MAKLKKTLKKTKEETNSSEIKEDLQKKEEEPKKKKHKGLNLVWIIIGGVAILLLIFVGTLGYLTYGKKSESAFIKNASKVLPFPAVEADGRFVSVYTYLDQLDILKNYYVNFKKTDLGSEDGKKLLAELRTETMARLTEDAIITVEAKKMGVSVSKKELNDSFDKLVVSNGGKDQFPGILKKFYGLTVEEFKEKIYAPRMLRQKMTDKINSEETVTGAAKKKADDLYAQLKKGANFAKLAKANSQDTASAANGGDLGFFGKGKMVPDFEKAAFALKVGEISKPIRTVYGYHIIKVTAKKGSQIRASHILIKVRDFNDWLSEKESELGKKHVWLVLPGIWQFYKL